MENLIEAIILGVVEGLTEFLPVSSTGHLLLLGHFLGFESNGKSFEVLVQLGAILAIMLVYFRRLLDIAMRLGSDPLARRFVDGELVRERFPERPVPDLPGPDVGRDLRGETRRVQHAKGRAPGVTKQDDTLRTDASAHGVDQLVEVGDETFDRHGGPRDRRVVRLPGGSLVPVNGGERLLERGVVSLFQW